VGCLCILGLVSGFDLVGVAVVRLSFLFLVVRFCASYGMPVICLWSC